MSFLERFRKWFRPPETEQDLKLTEDEMEALEQRLGPFIRSWKWRLFLIAFYLTLGVLIWRQIRD